MKLRLLYLGLLAFVGISSGAIYHASDSAPVPTPEIPIIQELPTSLEANQPEIKLEPAKPVKTTPAPIAAKIENQEDLKLKQLEYDRKVRKDEQEELEIQWKAEEKELERKNQEIADKRAADLAQAKLIAQRKADADYAAAQKKYEQCRKNLRDCMNDIGSKIMGLSGSAYSAAARAYGDSCNRQYSCN